ncbi:MAG: CBS domain-containing protein [Actinobacteria bacterium]|nr:MAG: CBS domain-containing protein [Actinomycetota bacterium]
MVESVREVMTPNPTAFPATATVGEAARAMRDLDIGDVIVLDNEQICGIVTDRDIVVRAVADGREPAEVKLGDICSHEITTLAPTDEIAEAAIRMRERAIRRLPVVEHGRPIGVVSIGDLAAERDPGSALADISAAPPNS